MSKKILIVSEYFYPEDNSTSIYLTEIARKLAEKNSVKVVCSTNNKGLDEDRVFEVVRIKESTLNKNNILSRGIKFLIVSIKLAWMTNKSIKQNTYVLSVTNPAFIIVLLSFLKKIRKFHLTFLVYDVFPENLIAAGLIKKPTSLFYRVLKKIFDWSYKQADHLIVIGQDMREVMRHKTDNKVPMHLIQNWCDYTAIDPKRKEYNNILKQYDIVDKKVFLFAGNLGRVQGIDNLLYAASLVKNENFVLLFLGDGAMKREIQDFISRDKTKNVIYAGAYPTSAQNLFLNACDVALVSLGKLMYGLGVPSKSYFSMAAAKPILFIGDESSEIASVIKKNDIGWVVENDHPELLAEKFEQLCSEDIDFFAYGERARNILKSNFSKDVILKKYEDYYEQLI